MSRITSTNNVARQSSCLSAVKRESLSVGRTTKNICSIPDIVGDSCRTSAQNGEIFKKSFPRNNR